MSAVLRGTLALYAALASLSQHLCFARPYSQGTPVLRAVSSKRMMRSPRMRFAIVAVFGMMKGEFVQLGESRMQTMTTMQIGQSDIHVAPLGVGVWAWGDRGFWGYGITYGKQDVNEAFVASINAGITLFDTAEIYGAGESERILGSLIRTTSTPAVVASKFAPTPWRLSASTIASAVDLSLYRLGLQQIDLYQIHWPFTLIPIPEMMNALADQAEAGKIRAIGVSNFSAAQMYQAAETLARRNLTLASNQVHYSLLQRSPEANGVLQACRDLKATLIAYSPLEQGLLTGKYSRTNPPTGPRFLSALRYNWKELERLIGLLREVGAAHGGKSPAQVAMNWLIAQGDVLPIPGAKNARQAHENAGALGWSLTPAQVEAIDEAAHMWRR